MTIPDFIEKAVDGGWRPGGVNCTGKALSWIKQAATNRAHFFERYLLDPKAWEAVGKVERWADGKLFKQSVPARTGPRRKDGTRTSYPAVIRMQRSARRPNEWKKKMVGLAQALADGGTIEGYLQTI